MLRYPCFQQDDLTYPIEEGVPKSRSLARWYKGDIQTANNILWWANNAHCARGKEPSHVHNCQTALWRATFQRDCRGNNFQ